MRYEILKFERIRNLRIDNNYTQKQIAQYLNVKQNTYSQYELGVLNYPIDVLMNRFLWRKCGLFIRAYTGKRTLSTGIKEHCRTSILQCSFFIVHTSRKTRCRGAARCRRQSRGADRRSGPRRCRSPRRSGPSRAGCRH